MDFVDKRSLNELLSEAKDIALNLTDILTLIWNRFYDLEERTKKLEALNAILTGDGWRPTRGERG